MEWLNYHHLLYFWAVAKHGSERRAAEELRLAQPTISEQIHTLERTLGERLFVRSGRALVLTEMGRIAFWYAENIFSLGQDLLHTLKGHGHKRPVGLVVGIADAVPKLLACELLKPAFTATPNARVVCWQGKLDRLLTDLAVLGLDLVISDVPAPPALKVQAHNHLMGESGVTLFGSTRLAARYRRHFPRSLEGAPLLVPTADTMLRHLLDQWLIREELHPVIVGEFQDSATLKAFGGEGYGLFPGSTIMEREICRQYRVRVVSRLRSVKQRFYAITVNRRLTHPAVSLIVETARQELSS